MGIQSWAVIGVVAGLLVKWRLPDRTPGGYVMASLLGVCGGVIGGFLSTFAGMGSVVTFDVGSSLGALAGALFILFLFSCPDDLSRVTSRLWPRAKQDGLAATPEKLAPEDQLAS